MMSRMTRMGAAVALGLAVAFPPAPAAAIGQDEAAKQVAEAYGVEVLKVSPGEVDGRPVWLLVVMNPGGNSNGAFQVTTLAVDKDSGALVPSFRHETSGYSLSGAPLRDDKVGNRPDAIRSRAWR